MGQLLDSTSEGITSHNNELRAAWNISTSYNFDKLVRPVDQSSARAGKIYYQKPYYCMGMGNKSYSDALFRHLIPFINGIRL